MAPVPCLINTYYVKLTSTHFSFMCIFLFPESYSSCPNGQSCLEMGVCNRARLHRVSPSGRPSSTQPCEVTEHNSFRVRFHMISDFKDKSVFFFHPNIGYQVLLSAFGTRSLRWHGKSWKTIRSENSVRAASEQLACHRYSEASFSEWISLDG